MRLYDLNNGIEATYSHNDPVMAFAQYYASTNSLNTQFSANPKAVADKVRGRIRKGQFGYHMDGLSIPFASIKQ